MTDADILRRRDTVTLTHARYEKDIERSWKAGYDQGYRDAQYFFRSYSGYDENENDENFND